MDCVAPEQIERCNQLSFVLNNHILYSAHSGDLNVSTNVLHTLTLQPTTDKRTIALCYLVVHCRFPLTYEIYFCGLHN
jgi:hypothetical protein